MKCLFLYINSISSSISHASTDLFDEYWIRVQGSSIHTGIASLSAVAASRHVECQVFDTSHFPAYKLNEIFREKLLHVSPDILAITCFTQNWNLIKTLLSYALDKYQGKRPVIIIGGPHVSGVPESVMAFPFIDIAVLGEGEEPFIQIVESLRKKKGFDHIPGIWFRKGAKIVKNSHPVFVSDLDTLPYPDWKVFDAYYLVDRSIYSNHIKVGVFNTSRGCPYHCFFCQNDTYKRLYNSAKNFHREQSAERVIDEIEEKLHKYHFSLVVFLDETFIINLRRLEKIAKAYKKRINLPCIVQTRPETLNHQSLRLLKDMGVIEIRVGLECGNEEYRKRILGRNISNRMLMKKLGIAREFNMAVTSYNIIGLPFETRDMIIETIELNKAMQVTNTYVTIFQPLPGTRLFDFCLEHDLFLGDDPYDLGFGCDKTIIKTNVSQNELCELKKMFPNVL